MKRRTIITAPVILAGVAALVIAAGSSSGGLPSQTFSVQPVDAASDEGTAKAVFIVHCYDEGKVALDGRKGVKAVTRGFLGFREINAVTYDPREASIGELEDALKKAGTYVKTIR